jgi:hypothetical protein
LLLAACFGSALHACGPKGGTDVGNGAAVRYNLRAYGQVSPDGAQPIVLPGGVEVDAVWVVAGSLRLKAVGACAADDEDADDDGGEGDGAAARELRYDAPIVANLLDQGVLGEHPELEGAAGKYCQLQVSLEGLDAAALPPSAPAELAGSSVVVRGRRADGVAFVASTRSPIKLKLQAKRFTFEVPNGDNAHIVGFDLSAMVAALGLETLQGAAIVVDETSAPERVKAFDRAVKGSAKLFRDGDGDGALSAAEREPGIELAEDQGED